MEGVEELLDAVRRGVLHPRAAATALRKGHLPGGKNARLDFRRVERTGLPEIILGEGKSLEDFQAIVGELRRFSIGAILSRLSSDQMRWIRTAHPDGLRWSEKASLAVLPGRRANPLLRGGKVALFTAGTVDVRVGEEIRMVLEALGAEVLTAYDVGVAGLHRLQAALLRAQRAGAMVYVVCAGREGALPTVVAGLVDRPVVGVPTSSGYGRGGQGEAALTSMLQSCAPLAVVNIDGGVPAALVTAQMLRQMVPARRGTRRTPPSGKRPGGPRAR